LGLKPQEFWELTPAELNAMAEGYRWRQEQRQQELTVLAWTTAALIRQKKLPRLERLLKSPESERHKKTAEEARREWEELQKEFGL